MPQPAGTDQVSEESHNWYSVLSEPSQSADDHHAAAAKPTKSERKFAKLQASLRASSESEKCKKASNQSELQSTSTPMWREYLKEKK